MFQGVFFYYSFIEVSVAVSAAKMACIVNSHIRRLNTAATFPLVFIYYLRRPDAEQFLNQIAINTGAMSDPERLKLDILTAGE